MPVQIELKPSDKILITGGTGLVGSALNSRLASLGYSNVASVGTRDCNLLNASQVEELFAGLQPDYVFHMAARVHGLGGNAKYKSDVLVENTIMNINVIEASRRQNVKKIVAMGSGCVYPDLKNTEELFEEYVFNGSPHPSEDSYGHSKRLMLSHLEAARTQYGLNSAFVISGNMYGPGDSFNIEDGHVIPSLISKFFMARESGTPVKVWGSGVAIRDFTHANDMAHALELIMQGAEGHINAGSGYRHAIRDIVDVLQNLTGVDVEWQTDKPDGQLVRYYNLDKLYGLGFKPEIQLGDGVSSTFEWFENQYPNIRN
jgi:GDP-L-fucose synthase